MLYYNTVCICENASEYAPIGGYECIFDNGKDDLS